MELLRREDVADEEAVGMGEKGAGAAKGLARAQHVYRRRRGGEPLAYVKPSQSAELLEYFRLSCGEVAGDAGIAPDVEAGRRRLGADRGGALQHRRLPHGQAGQLQDLV